MGQTRRRLPRRMQGAHSIHGGLGRARDHPHPPTHTPSLPSPQSGFMSGASCSGWRLPQQQLSPIWLYFLPSGMMGQKCLDLQADGSNPSCTAARIHVASDEPPNSPRLPFFLCELHLPWRATWTERKCCSCGHVLQDSWVQIPARPLSAPLGQVAKPACLRFPINKTGAIIACTPLRNNCEFSSSLQTLRTQRALCKRSDGNPSGCHGRCRKVW